MKLKCTFTGLRSREVINTATGARIGYIDDLEIDTETGKVNTLIIFGRPRLFGLLGKDDDVVISCEDIVKIGTDTVLVTLDAENLYKMSKERHTNLFE